MDELDIDELCSTMEDEMKWQLQEWERERMEEMYS